MLRANRYTLEYIRRDSVYTFCFFDPAYKEQVMLFGSESGRTGDKMKRHTLTPVQTPNGSIAYKEAAIIIECRLIHLTSLKPDDFGEAKMRSFMDDAFVDAQDYEKMTGGKITGIWLKK